MTFIERIKRLLGRGSAGRNGNRTAGGMASGEMPAMIACEEALTYLYEYLDGELDEEPCEQVRAHFEMCKLCYPHLKLEESFLEALQRAADGCGSAPDSLRTRVLEELAAEPSG